MRKTMLFAAALAMSCASAMEAVAADKAPVSFPASMPSKGCFRSDRTMEDIKESEAAMKEQWQKQAKTAGSRFKQGTYTDLNDFVWKYGLTLPVRVEAGAKYPVFIGNTGWTLATSESQARYPCYILNVYMPDTLFKPKPQGFDAPADYKTVTAAAYQSVLEKVIAEYPNVDTSRIYVEGASKFGTMAWIAAYNYPDTFAATLPSVAGCDTSKAIEVARRKIGIWLFYGILDGGEPDFKKTPHARTGPYMYKAITDAGYDAMLTIYNHGDHHEYGFSDSLKNPEWNDFTRLRKWLFAQKKPTATWPIISSSTTAAGTIGQPFTYKITADKDPKSFIAALTIEHAEANDGTIAKPERDLPKDLTFDTKTGVISGTPKEAGRFFIRLGAANDKGTGITTLSLTVKEK